MFVSEIFSLEDCLRYDLATSDKTSTYGACITYRGSGTTTWSYVVDNGYRISIANSTEGMNVLSELTGKNDFTVEFDVKMNNVQSVTSNAIGLCAYEDNNNYSRINLTNVKIAQRISVNGTANTKFGICGIWQKLWAERNYFKNIKVKPL